MRKHVLMVALTLASAASGGARAAPPATATHPLRKSVAADVSEESAKLSALQTQQQFAVQAFTMGTQNQQGLLRLLS